jgi:hypothetical protein
MFKIGDIVKIIRLRGNRTVGDIKIGMIGKVVRVVDSTYVNLDIESKYNYDGGFWFNEIKKIKREIVPFGIVKWCKENYK